MSCLVGGNCFSEQLAPWSAENQERKRQMLKNENRKGLAIGALVSLVASLLLGTTPAQAAVVALPNTGTTYETLVGETFAVKFVADSTKPVAVKMTATGHSGSFDVTMTTSNIALTTSAGLASRNIPADSTSPLSVDDQALTSVAGYVTDYDPAVVNELRVSFLNAAGNVAQTPANVDTTSDKVTVTVTIWEDVFADGTFDTANEVGQTITINFNPWSVLAPAVTMNVLVGDTTATASATVGNVNLAQLGSSFGIKLVSSESAVLKNAVSVSATAIADGSIALSDSAAVAALGGGHTVSAQVLYANRVIGAPVIKTAAALTFNRITISPIVGANLVGATGTAADARINAAVTLHAYPQTGSPATGSAVSAGTSMFFTLANFGAGESVTVNGVSYTQSLAAANAVALGSGEKPINITSVGLTGGDETMAVTVFNGNQSYTYTVRFKTPTFTVQKAISYQTMSVAVGSSVNLDFTVEDQFGELSSRTNTQISAVVNTGGSESDAVTASVVAGAASVTVTPVPSTRTGSATVTVTLQALNLDTGIYDAVGGSAETVDFIITADANSFEGRTPFSTSTSVSYIVDDEAWAYTTDFTLTVANSFSFVTATATGLTIKNGSDATDTASGTLTVQADGSGVALFQFAGTKAGTHVVTFTNGTDTTTSEVVIDAAGGNKGYTLSISGADSSLQGKSLTYTGLLTDFYGNPVYTDLSDSTADLSLTITGPGLLSGSLPTETDENGEFKVTVQSAANDEGTITIAGSYRPTGAGSAASTVKSGTATTAISAPVVAKAATVSVAVATATVEAGRTADVTITVTDDQGNAHAYKSVVVYSTGAGYLSAQTVTTDGNGVAVVKLITSTRDSGVATITASVDGKSGEASVTVEAPVVEEAAAPEVFAGSFNGRWAVRVENGTSGDIISIRVGGNWYKFTYTSDTGSQLFHRKSTLGATVGVTVWINGKQMKAETVTIR